MMQLIVRVQRTGKKCKAVNVTKAETITLYRGHPVARRCLIVFFFIAGPTNPAPWITAASHNSSS